MVDVRIEADNLEQWRKLGLSVGRSLSDARMIRNVSTVLKSRFERLSRDAFKSQGSSTGQGWKALSEPYATIKARTFPGKTILRRSNALFKSYTKTPIAIGTKSGQGFVFRYGSKDFKAKFHQKGGGRLPARKVLQYTPQQLRGITGAIGRTILEGVFARDWFDSSKIRVGFKNSGFDRISIP